MRSTSNAWRTRRSTSSSPERWTRPISETRACATAEELAKRNDTLWSLAQQKLVQFVSAIGAAILALVNWASSFFEGHWSLLDHVGDTIKHMPVWGWAGAAAIALSLGFYLARRGEADQVEKYRRGELL